MGVKLYKKYVSKTSIQDDFDAKHKTSYTDKRESTIENNSKMLKDKYGFNEKDGSFGQHNSGSARVYNITSNEPETTANEFWEFLSKGGVIKNKGNDIMIATLKDKTTITYRRKTKSGPPAIEINTRKTNSETNIKSHKIHFKKEDNK